MTGRAGGAPNPSMRAMNMNAFAAQQSTRQNSRLQNTQKTGLGNGNAGNNWAFGAPSSFGGLGVGAPGMAPRPPLSGFAQVMGGGSGQGPIDMSDFPTLSGAQRSQPTPSGAGAGTWSSSNTLRQPSTVQPQQSLTQQPRAPSTAPSHQSLEQSTTPYNSSSNTNNNNGSSLGSPDQAQPQENGHQAPSTDKRLWAELSEQENFGIAGLEAMFRYRDDQNNNVPGDPTLPQKQRNQSFLMSQDISATALHMDVETQDSIYPTFTVFDDPYDASDSSLVRRRPIPDFPLSDSYHVTNVPPLIPRMQSLSDETLFVVFYQNPRGMEQEMAAIQLHERFWRWHKLLRRWLQKDTREANAANSPALQDMTNGAPLETRAIQVNDTTERGIFIFFEPTPHWRRERKEFTLNYDELDHRQGATTSGTFAPGGL